MKKQITKEEVIDMLDDVMFDFHCMLILLDYNLKVNKTVYNEIKKAIYALRPSFLEELENNVEAYEYDSDTDYDSVLNDIADNVCDEIQERYVVMAEDISEEIYQKSLL